MRPMSSDSFFTLFKPGLVCIAGIAGTFGILFLLGAAGVFGGGGDSDDPPTQSARTAAAAVFPGTNEPIPEHMRAGAPPPRCPPPIGGPEHRQIQGELCEIKLLLQDHARDLEYHAAGLAAP